MTLHDWLLLPFGVQWRLAIWLPLLGYGGWLLLVRVCGVRSPRTRFWSLLAVSALIPLIFVPPILDVLPHVMGWESGVIPEEDLARLVSQPETAPTAVGLWSVIFLWHLIFIGIAFHCALFIGIAEHLWAWIRILLLTKHREGGVWVLDVPGQSAFTFGLMFPKVYVSREVWNGPHREAVIAHERTHARRWDPLLLFVARGIRRSTLYLPFGGRIFEELCLEAERSCDLAGTRAAGRKRYASALIDFAESDTPLMAPAATMNFGLKGSILPKPRLWLPIAWVVATILWFVTFDDSATPDLSLMPGWPGLPGGLMPLLIPLVAFTLLVQFSATSTREDRIVHRVRALLPSSQLASWRPERAKTFWVLFSLVYALILLVP